MMATTPSPRPLNRCTRSLHRLSSQESLRATFHGKGTPAAKRSLSRGDIGGGFAEIKSPSNRRNATMVCYEEEEGTSGVHNIFNKCLGQRNGSSHTGASLFKCADDPSGHNAIGSSQTQKKDCRDPLAASAARIKRRNAAKDIGGNLNTAKKIDKCIQQHNGRLNLKKPSTTGRQMNVRHPLAASTARSKRRVRWGGQIMNDRNLTFASMDRSKSFKSADDDINLDTRKRAAIRSHQCRDRLMGQSNVPTPRDLPTSRGLSKSRHSEYSQRPRSSLPHSQSFPSHCNVTSSSNHTQNGCLGSRSINLTRGGPKHIHNGMRLNSTTSTGGRSRGVSDAKSFHSNPIPHQISCLGTSVATATSCIRPPKSNTSHRVCKPEMASSEEERIQARRLNSRRYSRDRPPISDSGLDLQNSSRSQRQGPSSNQDRKNFSSPSTPNTSPVRRSDSNMSNASTKSPSCTSTVYTLSDDEDDLKSHSSVMSPLSDSFCSHEIYNYHDEFEAKLQVESSPLTRQGSPRSTLDCLDDADYNHGKKEEAMSSRCRVTFSSSTLDANPNIGDICRPPLCSDPNFALSQIDPPRSPSSLQNASFHSNLEGSPRRHHKDATAVLSSHLGCSPSQFRSAIYYMSDANRHNAPAGIESLD